MPILILIIASCGAVVILLILAGALAKIRLKAAYPPAGSMIDIGGCKLHAVIQGEGSVTVIFESGVGGLATHWEKVQPEIAKSVRTISYDRAGFGWSDAGKQPRRFEAMAEELEAMLSAADVSAPYVLVGHSFGGVVVRQFAKAHPEAVAGIVLVDSAHEEQFTKRFPDEVQQMAPKMIRSMRPMVWAFASGIPALLVNKIPSTAGLSDAAAKAERAVRAMSGKYIRTMLDEMDAIVHHPPQPIDSLGSIPLIVLSHGLAQPAPNMSAEINAAYEEAWQQMQRELAQLSSNSQHIVVEGSGHDIQLEKPDFVVQAIHSVLGQSADKAA